MKNVSTYTFLIKITTNNSSFLVGLDKEERNTAENAPKSQQSYDKAEANSNKMIDNYMKNEERSEKHANVHDNPEDATETNRHVNAGEEETTTVGQEMNDLIKKGGYAEESQDYIRESDEEYYEDASNASLAEADLIGAGYDYEDDYYYKSKSKGDEFDFQSAKS